MNHKRPNWDKCNSHGLSQNYPHTNPLLFGSPAKVGMEAWAQFGEHTVFLLLSEQLNDNEFIATIKFFEPVLLGSPKDLLQGDTVIIDREHICWISEGI